MGQFRFANRELLVLLQEKLTSVTQLRYENVTLRPNTHAQAIFTAKIEFQCLHAVSTSNIYNLLIITFCVITNVQISFDRIDIDSLSKYSTIWGISLICITKCPTSAYPILLQSTSIL